MSVVYPAQGIRPSIVPILEAKDNEAIRDEVVTTLADMSQDNVEWFDHFLSDFWQMKDFDRLSLYLSNPPIPIMDQAGNPGFAPSQPDPMTGQPKAPQWGKLLKEFPDQARFMLTDLAQLAKRHNLLRSETPPRTVTV